MLLDEGCVLGDRYALQDRLAVGGMGEVWCAEDRVLGRLVAIKLAKPELRADPGFPDRLLTEARHAAAVHHPGIAAVYDVRATDPLPYLVLELVDGRPLSQIVREEAPLDPERTRRLICQVAEALEAAHAAGLVHRDVKPANLLVTDGDIVKVTDFGIARAADSDSITRTGFVTGTAQYLSPEQAGGHRASAASDMYALGVVAYECLTGRRPFEGAPLSVLWAHREEPVPELPDDLPADLRRLVLGLLDKDPDRRPTAAQVTGREVQPTSDATSVLRLPSFDEREPGDDGGPPTAEHAFADAVPAVAAPAVAPSPPEAQSADRQGAAGRPGLLAADQARKVLAVAAGVVVLLVAVVAVLVTGAEDDDGGSQAAGGTAPEPLQVSAASLFHPGGSDGDYPEEVPLAVDGDPSTAWKTQRYASPQFGNLRPGVGLMFDLGEPQEVRELHLSLASPGLDLRVHAGDQPGDGLLETPALATVSQAPASTVVSLEEPTTARYWVVWVERLPASGQASVAETAFVG